MLLARLTRAGAVSTATLEMPSLENDYIFLTSFAGATKITLPTKKLVQKCLVSFLTPSFYKVQSLVEWMRKLTQ